MLGELKHFYCRLTSPWVSIPLLITINKTESKMGSCWRWLKCNTTSKQKAKWAAIEDGDHIQNIEKQKATTKQQRATNTKNNTRTTALERSVEDTTGGSKHLQPTTFTLGPDATPHTEIHENSVRIRVPNSVKASKRKHEKKVREKSRECHNHKPQPFPDPKRKRNRQI